MSEARADERLDRLEADVREIKTTLAGLAGRRGLEETFGVDASENRTKQALTAPSGN